MKLINMRSDIVTLPTDQMREAARHAEVGEDGRREDPTTNRLQDMVADMFAKEAALFFPSGTMANLASLMAYCDRGSKVMVGETIHIHKYERGGFNPRLGGFEPVIITETELGHPELDSVARALSDHDIALVCAENTHNYAGGVAHTADDLIRLREAVGTIPIHIDGSRIFNAAVCLDTDVASLTRAADSVMFCLSKGLGGPIGSLLCGSSEFIDAARQARSWLGGQMRQTGIVAAAGIVALEQGIDRLREDHDNARFLARNLLDIDGLSINMDTVQTNMVKVSVAGLGISAPDFVTRMEQVNVRTFPLDDTFVRIVVHKDISRSDIESAVDRIAAECNSIRENR